MARAHVQTITMRDFRRLDSLSGELRVERGSRTRSGVRRQRGHASCNSLQKPAGSDDASGTTAGESAQPSVAHAAARQACADSARNKVHAGATPNESKSRSANTAKCPKAHCAGIGGEPPTHAKTEEGQWKPRLWLADGDIQKPPEPLPTNGLGFVEAVNKEIELVGVGKSLLLEKDPRIKQKVWEQLIDIAYGKNQRVAVDEMFSAVDCVPRPVRD